MPSLLASVLLAASRVAVVYGGADPATGGALEQSVEARLLTLPDVVVPPSAELVQPTKAGSSVPPADAAAHAQATALLEKAESAYFEGGLDDASAFLASASALHAKSVDVAPDRPRLLLLRAAVSMKQQRVPQAEADIRAALFLAHDFQAPQYPPSVVELLERVRSTMPARLAVRFLPVPATAELAVDGRPVSGGVAVLLPGTHRLSARAPGHRTISRAVVVAPNEVIRVRLPLALEAGADDAIAAWVWSAEPARKAPDAVMAVMKAGSLDKVVVVSTRTKPGGAGEEARAVVWSRREVTASPVFASGDAAALASWSSTAIATGAATTVVPAVAAATPVARNPAEQPRKATSPRASSGSGRKKTLLWGAVGAGVLALGAGAAAASQSGAKSKTRTNDPGNQTTVGGW